jgi:hypothetical protein
MAGRRDYVRIGREELEDWLTSLPHKWSRKAGRQGIYYVHFSDNVGCSVSTTIGRDDAAVGLGRGSMSLTLVSLVTGRTLNRKDKDRKHFQRSKNWRVTWAKGVAHWHGVYQKAGTFYEKIAPIADRDEYKADALAAIEGVPRWESNDLLKSFHEQVSRGSILSEKQMAVVFRIKGQGQGKLTPATPAPTPQAPNPSSNDYWVGIAREMWAAANRRGHEFGKSIAESVGRLFKAGRDPSERQWRAFLNMLDQAQVPYDESKVPSSIGRQAARLAALYMANQTA